MQMWRAGRSRGSIILSSAGRIKGLTAVTESNTTLISWSRAKGPPLLCAERSAALVAAKGESLQQSLSFYMGQIAT